MRQERIRVIQWATGAVGVEAVKIMADRPGLTSMVELPPIPPFRKLPIVRHGT